jgi:lysozyme family protein
MANFLAAHRLAMKNEGGWNLTPGDRGGETFNGISRNNFPKWAGWAIIDNYKKLYPDTFKEYLVKDGQLNDLYLSFYRTNFWNVMMGDQLVSQNIADSIYDSAINMGVKESIMLTQDTIFNNLLNGIQYGTMDQKTLNALNNMV